MRASLRTIPAVLALLLVVLTGLAWSGLASRKAFWFDELFTLSVAEVPLGAPLWQAMTAGFEFNPPAAYLAVKISETFFGRSELTSRLPFLLAGLALLLMVFFIHAKRYSAWTGFWVALFVLHTEISLYFIEARGYIFVVLGATICWFCISCVEQSGRWRYLRAAGIFLSICLALMSHMWAVVLPAVVVAVLLFTGWRARHLDTGALLALACTAPCLLIFSPLARATKSVVFDNPIYDTPYLSSVEGILQRLPLHFFILLLLWLIVRQFQTAQPLSTAPPRPDFDSLFSAGLVLAPLVIFTVTSFTSTPYMRRYALLAALGACSLLARFWTPLFERTSNLVRCLLLVAALLLTGFRYFQLYGQIEPSSNFQFDSAGYAALKMDDAPIVFANALDLLPANRYTSSGLRPRFRYVADRRLAIRYSGTDGVDSALQFGRSYLHLESNLISRSQLEEMRTPFWLIDSTSSLNWLVPAVVAAGFQLETQYSNSRLRLLRVTPNGNLLPR